MRQSVPVMPSIHYRDSWVPKFKSLGQYICATPNELFIVIIWCVLDKELHILGKYSYARRIIDTHVRKYISQLPNSTY